MFLETLVLARLLGPTGYGTYAFIVQIAYVLMFVAVGAGSGYVFTYYTARDTTRLSDVYVIGAVAQYALGATVAAVVLAAYQPHFVVGVVLFAIYVPWLISEPMLRVRNDFTRPVIAKALGSIGTLALALGLAVYLEGQTGSYELTLTTAVVALLVGNAVGYGVYYLVLLPKSDLAINWSELWRASWRQDTWRAYRTRILGPGVRENLSTVVFLVFTFIDRSFIEHFRAQAQLSVYSLAWQLSQGAVLLLTSLNVVSRTRIGEALQGGPHIVATTMKRQLYGTAAIGAAMFGVLVILAALLASTIYSDYRDLLLLTAIIGLGWSCYNVAGAVTPLLIFERRWWHLAGGYAALATVSVLGNLATLYFGWWYGTAVAISSGGLAALNVVLVLYTRHLARIRQQGRKGHGQPSLALSDPQSGTIQQATVWRS